MPHDHDRNAFGFPLPPDPDELVRVAERAGVSGDDPAAVGAVARELARRSYGKEVDQEPARRLLRGIRLGGEPGAPGEAFDVVEGDPATAHAVAVRLARAAAGSGPLELVGPLEGASVQTSGRGVVVRLASGLELGFEVVPRGGRWRRSSDRG